MKYKVFVYGTLRKNYGNNVLLHSATFIGNATCNGTMYSFGHFPYVCLSEQDKLVYGEVYEVDEDTLARLDRLEGHNEDNKESSFYDRTLVHTSIGDAFIYHIEYRDNTKGLKVESGDWNERKDKASSEGIWRNQRAERA